MYLNIKKECALHIPAPAAVACDIYLIRRSVHPYGAFFNLQESNFLQIKKAAARNLTAGLYSLLYLEDTY